MDAGRYYIQIVSYIGCSDTHRYIFSFSRENAITIEMPRIRADAGDTIQVPVSISNLPSEGVCALDFIVYFNKSILTYTGYEAGAITNTSDAYIEANELNSAVKLMYIDDSPTFSKPLVNPGGELIKLNFQVKAGVEDGAYLFSYFPGWNFAKLMPDGNLYEIENALFKLGILITGGYEASSVQSIEQPERNAGMTSVEDGQLILGDVNGDGYVNSTDYALMKRYILGIILEFPSERGLEAAELNGDGNVNSTDYSLLKRYILGLISEFPIANISTVSIVVDDETAFVGDIITASLRINNISDFAGYQVNIGYNPDLLQPVDPDTGVPYTEYTLPQTGDILVNTSYEYVSAAFHDLNEGRLNFGRAVKILGAYRNGGNPEISGELAKIGFKVLKQGSASLMFQDDANGDYWRAEGASFTVGALFC